ncbi:hypothetical protein ACOSP7_031081 [Xanthoceras sorbifolium]
MSNDPALNLLNTNRLILRAGLLPTMIIIPIWNMIVEPGLGPDNGPAQHGPDLVGQNTLNKGHHNRATTDQMPFHNPGTAAFLFGDMSTVASSMFHNRIYKKQLFPSKKELRQVLETHALKENFDFWIRRSTTQRFEVTCSDIEC